MADPAAAYVWGNMLDEVQLGEADYTAVWENVQKLRQDSRFIFKIAVLLPIRHIIHYSHISTNYKYQ